MSRVLTKSEFYDSAINELSQYPEIAARIAAGDVTITQQLGAMCQMLAMLSAQIGIAEVETWIKARDNMVLADASARGVLPFAKASVYEALIVNNGDANISVSSGRKLLDNKGRIWVVQNGATIAPSERKTVKIKQYETVTMTHTVSKTQSFYSIPIPLPKNNQHILDISVQHDDGSFFKRAERFNNIGINERVYHLLADEMMNISIQFGVMGKIGYIPSTGEEITVNIQYTSGDISLPDGTSLDLEYIQAGEENLEIISNRQVESGSNPPSIAELREITNYPSIYDENAVFLGEFSFLLQRQLSPFVFLNVWNERQEEAARQADVANINTLFISFIKDGIDETEAKELIKRTIQYADNSYKIKFVQAVEKQLQVRVRLFLAPLHDEAEIKQKVSTYLLKRYGKNSVWAKKGGQRINWQQSIKELRENIIELQDGISDISLTVDDIADSKPEYFCYVTEDTINITSSKLEGY